MRPGICSETTIKAGWTSQEYLRVLLLTLTHALFGTRLLEEYVRVPLGKDHVFLNGKSTVPSQIHAHIGAKLWHRLTSFWYMAQKSLQIIYSLLAGVPFHFHGPGVLNEDLRLHKLRYLRFLRSISWTKVLVLVMQLGITNELLNVMLIDIRVAWYRIINQTEQVSNGL